MSDSGVIGEFAVDDGITFNWSNCAAYCGDYKLAARELVSIFHAIICK